MPSNHHLVAPSSVDTPGGVGGVRSAQNDTALASATSSASTSHASQSRCSTTSSRSCAGSRQQQQVDEDAVLAAADLRLGGLWPPLHEREAGCRPQRVCVTGATGYLAGHIVQRLLAAGHTVHGTVRQGHGPCHRGVGWAPVR